LRRPRPVTIRHSSLQTPFRAVRVLARTEPRALQEQIVDRAVLTFNSPAVACPRQSVVHWAIAVVRQRAPLERIAGPRHYQVPFPTPARTPARTALIDSPSVSSSQIHTHTAPPRMTVPVGPPPLRRPHKRWAAEVGPSQPARPDPTLKIKGWESHFRSTHSRDSIAVPKYFPPKISAACCFRSTELYGRICAVSRLQMSLCGDESGSEGA
jgi:hypothetical protein